MVYDAGYSPICPMLYLPLCLNDAVPEEHKNGIDMEMCIRDRGKSVSRYRSISHRMGSRLTDCWKM